MNVDEVRALRRELENAILEACVEFKQATGLSIIGVSVQTTLNSYVGIPTTTVEVSQVSITIESI